MHARPEVDHAGSTARRNVFFQWVGKDKQRVRDIVVKLDGDFARPLQPKGHAVGRDIGLNPIAAGQDPARLKRTLQLPDLDRDDPCK